MKPEVLVHYKYRPTVKPQHTGKFCYNPYHMIEIDEDGDVMLCGCQFHMPYVVGNIYQNSIKDIWLNANSKLVRDSVAAGEFTYCNWSCPNLQHLELRPNVLPNIGEFPTSIKIDLDRSCNLKCASCREHLIQEKNTQRIATQKAIFNEIFDYASSHTDQQFRIFPMGSGEVLASHSGLEFLRKLQHYPYSNIQVTAPSNGTLLWHHRDLIDSIQDKINFTISIDAATEETYAQVRGGNWQELQQGIQRYRSIIQHFCFVVQEANWREIEQFAEYADQLGLRADYQKLEDWGHWSVEWWFENNPLDRKKSHYHDVIDLLCRTRNRFPRSSFASNLVNLMNKKI